MLSYEKCCHNNNFRAGLANAQHLLSELEESIKKTRSYESKLFTCKSRHFHSHAKSRQEPLDDGRSFSFRDVSSRSPMKLGESWSTMSIVCLQYQYEELSKRYESLLQTYNERCKVIQQRDSSLCRMRELTDATQSEVTLTHQALLTVGQKYLDLKDKHISDKHNYENQISSLQQTIHRVSRMAKKARRDLDEELGKYLASERKTTRAALLAEVKRCNKLIIENINLKRRLQNLMIIPGHEEGDEQ